MLPSLSLIIPAYNEEKNLRECVESTLRALKKLEAPQSEIIIVNDGSTDKTGQLAEDLARIHENVLALHHSANKGIGRAIRTGFDKAKYDLVFYLPADGQMDINELSLYFDRIRHADIVVGRRVNRVVSPYRLLLSRVYNWMVRFLYRVDIRDVGWVKLLKRSVVNALKLESDSASIDVEILAKARKLGYKIEEVDVHELPRKAGKANGADLDRVVKLFFEILLLKTRL